MRSAVQNWQARRDSNPQLPDLESGALPLELLACTILAYFVSLWSVCVLQKGQYFLSSNLSVDFFLFLVVL